MKKTLLAFGLALGLGLSTVAFADGGGWDYSKHNSREAMIFSGQTERPSMAADTSSQNSKEAVLAVNTRASKEVGKMTVVVAEKGASTHTKTVAVTR
jgi:hypothetical protein